MSFVLQTAFEITDKDNIAVTDNTGSVTGDPVVLTGYDDGLGGNNPARDNPAMFLGLLAWYHEDSTGPEPLATQVATTETSSAPVASWNLPTAGDGWYETLMIFGPVWAASVFYLADKVVYDATTELYYVCLANHNSDDQPLSNTTYWKPILAPDDYPYNSTITEAYYVTGNVMQPRRSEKLIALESIAVAEMECDCDCDDKDVAVKHWLNNLIYFTAATYAAGFSDFEKVDEFIHAIEEN